MADESTDYLLTPDTLQQWCQEIREQPYWRTEADKCEDYYAGNQIDRETAEALEQRGMGELITNLVAPTINTVLGLEAKSRTDWRIVADTDDQQEIAEAISAKLAEAERESRADRACADAYASMVKTGIGWVAVTRNADPFKYPFKTMAVHRREMFWDWNSIEPDLSDARYVLRKRWFGLTEACAYLPEHAEVIKAAGSGWTAHTIDLITNSSDLSLMHALDQDRRTPIDDYEWRDTTNRRVCLYEVWYRHFVRGMVVETPGGRVTEYEPENPMHQMGVAMGVFQPRPAVFSKLRVSLWLGPHKLSDEPYGGRLPYIPFFGYREDLTGAPYGMIRAMIPLQDEVNARRRKLLWMLSAKRVTADSDALDSRYNDFGDLAREVARPDAVLITNPNRINKNLGVHVDNDSGLNQQQFQIMEESKKAIQEVAGVFNAMMGRDSGATSGLAINSLVEQGSNALGDINDNYRFSRRLVGEALVELIRDDMQGENLEVQTGEAGRRKGVALNVPVVDPATGLIYKHNDVSKASIKVALEDIPSTPAYKAQQQMQISEVLKSLPPQIQAPLVPFYLESTDLPKRREMADVVRKSLGLGEEGEQQDPMVAQLQQQLAMMQEQVQQGVQQYEAQIQQLTQQVQAQDLAIKDKAAEQQMRSIEQRQKEADAARSYDLNAGKLELDRARIETERLKIEQASRDAQANRELTLITNHSQEKSAERVAAAAAAVPAPVQEMPDVAAEVAKAIAPMIKSIDAIKATPAPAPAPVAAAPAPITLNLQIDAKAGTVKKTMTIAKDAEGNITGGTVTETESDK